MLCPMITPFPRKFISILSLVVAVGGTTAPSRIAAQSSTSDSRSSTGLLTGRVSNRGTAAYLEGAVVGVEGTNRVVRTDQDGSYRLMLPPGSHTLLATYTGLDPERVTVTIPAGGQVTQDFDLTSE